MNTGTYANVPPSSMLSQAKAYTDLGSLQGIKNEEDKDLALKKVAKQFESLFMHELLKNMRKANKPFEDDSLFDNKESNFFRDMYDQQLSLSISEQGTGLADVLYRQLQSSYGDSEASQGAPIQVKEIPTKRVDSNPYQYLTQSTADEPTHFESAESFIESVMPIAKKVASTLGLDPLIMVAQSALETGWGKHVIKNAQGESSFNLFNIKADSRWQGEKVSVDTLEYRDGVTVKERASFRKYNSMEESFHDFVDFLKTNSRYQEALDVVADGQKFLEKLQSSGYATDPQYASKISSVLKSVSERVTHAVGRAGD